MLFADISFNLPLNSLFTYLVPPEMESEIKVGKRVMVSFLKDKKKLGLVLNLHNNEPTFKVKNIQQVFHDFYTLQPYAKKMATFISSYYGAPFNEALHLFVPEKILKEKESKIPINKEYWQSWRSPKVPLALNKEQQVVVNSILKDSHNLTKNMTGLVFGITGSGKTEIYQRLLEETIKSKKQGLLLLPEIALTTQTIHRFAGFFGEDSIAVIHSRLTPKEKLLVFKDISEGKKSIIIGPRSALYSPFKNLGLIIMDEEQDFSYKSHRSPRYHTRHVAYNLAVELAIPFIMGSATPSLETFYAAKSAKIMFYELTKRYYDVHLPTVEIIDMSDEYNFFSPKLMKQIVTTKAKGEQSILFINRRGFSPLVMCKNCNYIVKCPQCSISLTYHKNTGDLLCHYCGHKEPYTKKCPQCNNSTLEPKGGGTQRIEEEISELFHSYKVLRMDKDSTQKKDAHNEIITAFKEQKADILIGTQMVVKGLDFPSVSLVGVLTCDTILNLPDFRSAEYTFTVLTQVAGRSGRKTQGEVLIQTRYPENYAILKAVNHDYKGFYEVEIQKRKNYAYPPFVKILRFIVRSELNEKAREIALKLAETIKKTFPHLNIIGPTPCVLERIANQYRYHFITKVKNPAQYGEQIKKILKEFNNKGNYHIEYDVDPITLM